MSIARDPVYPMGTPTFVPYSLNDENFNRWLNGATVDVLDKFYKDILLPEYSTINFAHKDMYTEEYTKIYNRIIAQTTGMKFVVNLVTMNREQSDDIKALKNHIKSMIGQIINDRVNKQRASSAQSAQSAQSDRMITVSENLFDNIRQQLYQCQQREIVREKQLSASGKLDSRIQDAHAALAQAQSHAANSLYNGNDYEIAARYRDDKGQHLESLERQQQRQKGRGRSKRSKRSKRVKRSKRSSTKRH